MTPIKPAPTAQAPASLLSPTFKYVPANQTDVRKTWVKFGWLPKAEVVK